MRANFWNKPRFKSTDDWTGEYQMLSLRDVAILVGAFLVVAVPIVVMAVLNLDSGAVNFAKSTFRENVFRLGV